MKTSFWIYPLGLGLGFLPAAWAASPPPAPLPVVVAESEQFEIVGRLDEKAFVFYVDRSATNEPVLGATLEIEVAGRTATALHDAAQGDYRVVDGDWLAAVRQPGSYPVAFTLLAGEESDLLNAEFTVDAASTAILPAAAGARWLLWVALGGGLLLAVALYRRQKGGAA